MKRVLLVLALLSASPAAAAAAELVMLERQACGWCERWHKEIGPIYPKTAESGIAPLRRVDIHKAWPADLEAVGKDVFTPTFILVEDGREVGRIRGYPGEAFFWGLLNELIKLL